MSNAQNFSLQISAFVAKAKGNMHLVTYKTVMDLGTRLVQRSPVGDKEFWAINDLTIAYRETLRAFRAESGRTTSEATLNKHFPTKGPAGYVGGRFRANWQYSTDQPAEGELYEKSPPTSNFPGAAQVIDTIRSGIGVNPAGKVHYIVNNLPYADRLENGWSKQAPSGMVGLTVAEFQGIVNDAVLGLK
jgi:hypothetical protein